MSLSVRHCYVVMCDVCRAEYTDPDGEYLVYFDDETAAEQVVRDNGWMVLARHLAERFVCPAGDAEHGAFVDSLLPPEPVVQIPGQVSFDGEVSS